MSVCISTARARTKSAARVLLYLWARHFPWEFPYFMALLQCPKFISISQGSHKTVVAVLGCVIFLVNSRIKLLLWHVHVHFGCAGSCMFWSCFFWRSWFLPTRSLHDLVSRSSSGDPGDVLSTSSLTCTGPCQKTFWRSCWNHPREVFALRSWRCSSLVVVCKFLWDARRKFSSEDCVSSCVLIYRSCCCSCVNV